MFLFKISYRSNSLAITGLKYLIDLIVYLLQDHQKILAL